MSSLLRVVELQPESMSADSAVHILQHSVTLPLYKARTGGAHCLPGLGVMILSPREINFLASAFLNLLPSPGVLCRALASCLGRGGICFLDVI